MARKQEPSGPAAGSKRLFKLAGMTAKLAGRYASHALANGFRDEEAQRQARAELDAAAGAHLASTLGELKGAVMKIGQFASQVADFLPAEIAEPLRSLQREAPPMPFAVIRRQLEQSLDGTVEDLFAELDPEPYAAASIGQVHRGRLADGREVVVKVQYPGVAASCDSDLKQLKLALRMARMVKVDKQVLDGLFEEIRARLHEELEYRQEAANMAEFAELFADTPKILIPEVVAELSTDQVLTMQLEEGDRLDELGAAYDERCRNDLALTLFHFMGRSIFEFGRLHADPNPGNFAFRPDGTLVVYDFGCVKRLEPDSIKACRDVVAAALKPDWAGVDDALHRLGVRVPGSAPLPEGFYAAWRPILLKPFLSEVPFDFARSTIHKAVMAKSPEVLKLTDRLQPPVKTAYVDRMTSGHYWTLVHLGARLQLRPELERYLQA